MFKSVEFYSFSQTSEIDGPSYKVKDVSSRQARISSAARTVSKHQNGLSVKETRIVSAATHYLWGFYWVWIVTAPHSKPEHEAREIIRDVRNRVILYCRRVGMPAYWMDILEGSAGVHSNLLVPVASKEDGQKLVASLARWKFDEGVVYGVIVKDKAEVRGYLMKECTTQAHYAANYSFTRKKGSHKLGEGGGDRVHLSKELEAALVGSGRIERRTRTYVSRALRNPNIQPARAVSKAQASVVTPVLARLNPSPYVSAFILAGRTRQIPLLLGPVF